ncbi:hypothetical protein JTB14_012161 [Gonioctena quinquepunctata]|nr:hypothetical protein JTB14_012161 [Gonioctena quinquepunctata]
MAILIGWLYCFLWYSSILAGYASLYCPLLPILFISNKGYRYITDVVFTYWQYYPTVGYYIVLHLVASSDNCLRII